MRLQPIISSLLENDLYKFSMGQCIFHQFSDYKTTWTFKCRNEKTYFTPAMVEEIRAQIRAYCDLRFTEEELDYLENIQWIKGTYVDFLRLWQPRYEDFAISTDAECGLSIETRGSWLNTSMYEIPTLAIVNEVYFGMGDDYDQLLASFEKRLNDKVGGLIDGTYCIGSFSEFGLRRRLSAAAQELSVRLLCENNDKYKDSHCIGTSNVYLAKKYGVTPAGTMAHEWIMCVGQGNHKHNPAYSNWYALDAWVKEYGILNGIALTDTITTECFLKDFQLTYAHLFSGVRHDSGDPFQWGERMLAHYESLGLDPKNKTLLFSDSLDFARAAKLYQHFKGRTKVAFGIGTYLSNDTNAPALNIVMKTTACNGMDVAKLSDTSGKGMCKNAAYVDYLTRCIHWRLQNERK
ncbi:MAG: nicotinate phosphoribosyltransferase [Blautia sp.]|nr:nicotinate phosphoribosyltransferase [Blautia sp.]